MQIRILSASVRGPTRPARPLAGERMSWRGAHPTSTPFKTKSEASAHLIGTCERPNVQGLIGPLAGGRMRVLGHPQKVKLIGAKSDASAHLISECERSNRMPPYWIGMTSRWRDQGLQKDPPAVVSKSVMEFPTYLLRVHTFQRVAMVRN